MKKNKFIEHIIKKNDLPSNTKVVLFKNPDKYKIKFIEKINPNHIQLVYGQRYKHSNIEKIAKIIIPSLIISEILTLMLYLTFIHWSIFTMFILFGIWVSDCDTLFFNFSSGIFEFYAKSGKYNNGYIRE